MKRSCFSEGQIIGILKAHEAGVSVADLCRKHGVSDASICNWKARHGGMDVPDGALVLRTLRVNAAAKSFFPDPMPVFSIRTYLERS